MENIGQLREWVRQKWAEYPQLKEQIIGFYELCKSEIEEGGSIRTEIDNCVHDIYELIDEQK